MSEPEKRDSGDRGTATAEKPRLDRQRILEAGAAFIEQFGPRHLSMRRLGTQLGVEAMSLYRYVPSRENLLDGIVEVVIDDLYKDPEVYSEPRHGWQDYLLRLAHGLRRLALAHPQVFPLIATRPTEAPWVRPPLRSLRWVESFLKALTSAGFSDQAAVDAYRAFSSFLLGHLLLEVAAMGADVGPVDEAEPRPPKSTDLNGYPLLQRLQERLSEDRSEQEFEEALESLLDRLEALQA
ncbi:TetR/AcrR family transcriptional regulator C-terminal domain-containing protein [Arthrobacter crystallopoietes]|jgi:AcrR family transcriptional regulator|uniref:TetR/AcrR family transcriptional regulator C-terminal domain-containing protein n=1 Tax=Crystallibacter crystallopoietes TaxID=37928 RepID=UPI00111134CD|nr:TetR/AcrR family transcriptional regulator C-terminal domain-containing protein [Arthrobacter crystallopoietes]QTG82713.1 TetR/AcrR family transcriptional regulator C-terminal domain-containing protein [Arthrobacter crystallopoietes]